MTAGLRVRTLTANFRSAGVSGDLEAGHDWETVRKPLALNLVRGIGPSIIFAQECSAAIREDLAAALGSNWSHEPETNVSVWWNNQAHTLTDWDRYQLPSPDTVPGTDNDIRRLVLAKFDTGGTEWWGASSHFTPRDAYWQGKQMMAACDYIRAAGAQRRVIFGGDFNAGSTTSGSPRWIARAAGLYDLRAKGPALGRIQNVKMNSYNGWKPPVYDGWWIDDVLTGEDWVPYFGRMHHTDGASDHNWIVMSAITLS